MERTFRPVLFSNLKEIKDIGCCLQELLENRLESGKLMIQDSLDMKVETFDVDFLDKLDRNNGFYFEGLSTGFSDKGFVVIDEYSGVNSHGNKIAFLNENLILGVEELEGYIEEFDFYSQIEGWDFFSDEDSDFWTSCYSLSLNYRNSMFKFSVIVITKDDDETYECCLFINNKYVCMLNYLAVNYSGEIFSAYFEVVQICKTKNGFELVLYLQEEDYYFGIRLNENLELINLYNFINLLDTEPNVSELFKQLFAKNKLLGV